jgi:hypothetical protein
LKIGLRFVVCNLFKGFEVVLGHIFRVPLNFADLSSQCALQTPVFSKKGNKKNKKKVSSGYVRESDDRFETGRSGNKLDIIFGFFQVLQVPDGRCCETEYFG